MRRRALLSALVAGLAGCLGGTDAGTLPANDAPPTDSATTDPETATPTRSDPPSGPVRCRGEPVSVDRTVDEAIRFEEMPFERWASIECAEAGLERVRSTTADRLGTDEFGSGVGQSSDFFPSDSLVVRLDVATRIEEGETTAPPAVSLSRLADVAPQSVDATLYVEGDEYSRTVPVFAEHVEVGPT